MDRQPKRAPAAARTRRAARPTFSPLYSQIKTLITQDLQAGVWKAGDDVSQARWVERACLPQYRITEGTLPVIEKAFRTL